VSLRRGNLGEAARVSINWPEGVLTCQVPISSTRTPESRLDIVVRHSSDPKVYDLTDRLGRPAGIIERIPPIAYVIRPERGGALAGLGRRTLPTLDHAMSAIALHTKGACQLVSEDNPD